MQELPPQEIQTLLAAAASGDVRSVGVLWRCYHRSVLAFIIAKGFDPAVAEEILSDVFLALLEKPLSYAARNDASFSTWLHGIAKHKMADRRRKDRHRHRQESIDEQDAQELPDPDVDLLAKVEDAELRRRLRVCLEELTPVQRFTARLFFYEEKSMDEIAGLLEAALGTVKSRLHYLKLRLAACVSGHGRHEGTP